MERLDDIIGRTDLIVRKPDDGIRKHQLISFDKLLARVDNEAAIRHVTDQQHGIDHVKDVEMLHAAAEAVENQKEISLEYTIANTDRACGAMLSGVIAAKYGEKGLPEHTLNVKFKGSAGQSFGAFLVPGVNFKLEGEANDYLGKGLSGGRIAVLPRYGATSRRRKTRLQATPCFMAPQAVKFTSTAVQASALPSATPVPQP